MAELGKAELNAMVAEATVDAHDEEEQVSGFFSMLEEHLATPFRTTVLGMRVTVLSRLAHDVDATTTLFGCPPVCHSS